jgi:hypothetical protein
MNNFKKKSDFKISSKMDEKGSGTYDIWRDSLLRYAGYANEVQLLLDLKKCLLEETTLFRKCCCNILILRCYRHHVMIDWTQI